MSDDQGNDLLEMVKIVERFQLGNPQPSPYLFIYIYMDAVQRLDVGGSDKKNVRLKV